MIASYGYEVYRGDERLFWYDDFPHPELAELASTFPHHKHLPPNARHNRVPAPEISFIRPNLPFLIDEIERLLWRDPVSPEENSAVARPLAARPAFSGFDFLVVLTAMADLERL